MHDFCPLCLKKGLRRKMKAIQINLNEAVWMCEAEECVWPFGYEEFVYLPRMVGKTWSCYWDNCKSNISNSKEFIPVSTELSMYTPPVTPCGDQGLKECITDSPPFIDIAPNNSNIEGKNIKITQVQMDIACPINTVDNSARLSLPCDQKTLDTSGVAINNEPCVKQPKGVYASNQNNICDQTEQNVGNEGTIVGLTDNMDDTMLPNTSSSSNLHIADPDYPTCFHHTKEEDKKNTNKADVSQRTNVVKIISELTSTKKTNWKIQLDSSNLKKCHQDNDASSEKNNCIGSTVISNPSVSNIQLLNNTEVTSCNQLQAQNVQNRQSSNTLVKNMEQNTVTTVKLDGLPPITLSYDASIFSTSSVPESDSSKSVKPAEPTISAQKLRSIQLSKRYAAESKKYKKFSFNAVKNKIRGQQTNCTDGTCNLNSSSMSNPDATLHIKIKPEKKDPGASVDQGSVDHAKSIESLDISSISNSCNTSCDNSVLNATISIDSFLDDFLRKDCSMSEEISDDWLNSLLV